MKNFYLRIFIGILTFAVGVSITTFWYFYPILKSPIDQSIGSQSEIISDESKFAWQTLLSFENRDLREISQENREQKIKLERALDVLIGRGHEVPRLISKISNSHGQSRYIYIQESPLVVIPGDSNLRVFVFNTEGKLLNSLTFPSGYRIGLKDIRVIYSPLIGREILEVESEPVINGRDIARQYYALIGENVLPIRLEDSQGKSVQNDYKFLTTQLDCH